MDVLLASQIVLVVGLGGLAAFVSSRASAYRRSRDVVGALTRTYLVRTGKMKDEMDIVQKEVAELRSKVGALGEEGGREYSRLMDHLETLFRSQLALFRLIQSRWPDVKRSKPETNVSSASGQISTMTMLASQRKLLGALTPTELAILRLLVREGSKSAPDICHHLQKSREHAARLMKKMYDEGYVEREMAKLPYKYKLSGAVSDEVRKRLG